MGHGKILDGPTPTEAIDFRLALGQQDGGTPADAEPTRGSLISIGDIRTRGRLQLSQASQGRPLGGRTQVGHVDKPSRQCAFGDRETRQEENEPEASRQGQQGQQEC